jgi:hypothetical protein
MATRMARKGTPNQIRRVIDLLGKAGYDTVLIDSDFKRLGATMAECDWTVERWLTTKKAFELDMLIERLQHVTQSEVRS